MALSGQSVQLWRNFRVRQSIYRSSIFNVDYRNQSQSAINEQPSQLSNISYEIARRSSFGPEVRD